MVLPTARGRGEGASAGWGGGGLREAFWEWGHGGWWRGECFGDGGEGIGGWSRGWGGRDGFEGVDEGVQVRVCVV